MSPTKHFGLIDYRRGDRWARIRGRVVTVGVAGDFRPIEERTYGSRPAANLFAAEWVSTPAFDVSTRPGSGSFVSEPIIIEEV